VTTPRPHERRELPEISDLVIDFDEASLERRPVSRSRVVAELRALGMHGPARLVASWPARGDVLDEAFVDGVLLRSHLELQRLSEEFQQGARVARLLGPVLRALREHGVPGPHRVVDVGSGPGYVIRWLAANRARLDLGDVELVGCDYNEPLVRAATRFAEDEGLDCRFVTANAFALDQPATIYLSSGVIHHVRGDGLARFLARQGGASAFLHTDIKPSWLAPLGAFIFHVARMREPLARHDGVQSAVRAHEGRALYEAATGACPERSTWIFDGAPSPLPILSVMQSLVSVKRELAPAFERELGGLARRLYTPPVPLSSPTDVTAAAPPSTRPR
jgi:SAM-dependent methyltransferase